MRENSKQILTEIDFNKYDIIRVENNLILHVRIISEVVLLHFFNWSAKICRLLIFIIDLKNVQSEEKVTL